MSPAEVRTLIAEVLGLSPGRVHENLGYGDVPQWDSLHHVELVLALEDRLGVQIEPEQMVELGNVSLIEEFAAVHAPRDESSNSPN
jgi:acyl carrier protein